jgi:hypothetical protein
MTATMQKNQIEKPVIKTLPITSLRFGGETQARAATCAETVKEYADALQSGAKFPPVIVFHDALNLYYVGDGTHRVMATLETGGLTIECEVRQGGLIEAKKYACSANKSHGLKRTNADKRKAVVMYWEIVKHESPRPSNVDIADWCGVSEHLVRDVVKADSTSTKSKSTVGKDGRTYNTSNIGKNTKRTPAAPAAPPKPDPKPEPPKTEDAIDSEPEADAEPEATPEPEQELDAAGVPIPEHVQPAFQFASQIIATCREIDAVVKKIEGFKTQFGGRLIRHDSAISQLKDARGNLFGNRCTHVCPYCFGTAAVCNACKGEGWTASHVWKSSPAAIKRS